MVRYHLWQEQRMTETRKTGTATQMTKIIELSQNVASITPGSIDRHLIGVAIISRPQFCRHFFTF
jgi:hypothetical protein